MSEIVIVTLNKKGTQEGELRTYEEPFEFTNRVIYKLGEFKRVISICESNNGNTIRIYGVLRSTAE